MTDAGKLDIVEFVQAVRVCLRDAGCSVDVVEAVPYAHALLVDTAYRSGDAPVRVAASIAALLSADADRLAAGRYSALVSGGVTVDTATGAALRERFQRSRVTPSRAR